MARAITLFPSSGECEDLTYCERVSRNRGLHVLLQDYSTAKNPTRRRFLQNAYREIISRYLGFGKIEHPRPLAVDLVDTLGTLAKKIDCRVGDFSTLGIYILFQHGDVCYLLASVNGTVRLRLQKELVELDPEKQPEVTRLPIESGHFQKELFEKNIHDFVALYRIQVPAQGSLDVVMGGRREDVTAVSDALRRPNIVEGTDRHATVPLDSISGKILFVRTGVVEPVRSLPPGFTLTKQSGSGARKGTVTFAVAAAVVFVALGAVWVSERLAGGGVEGPGMEAAVSEARTESSDREAAVQEPVAVETEPAGAPASGRGPEETDPPRVDLAVSWDKSYSQAVTSSPLLIGEMVVFGCRDGRLYALGKNDGRVLWRYSAADGIGASPAGVASGIITADYSGHVAKVGRDDGKLLWNCKLPQKVVSSPVVSGGEVLVGCYDGYAYALSVETGRILWKIKTGGRIRGTAANGEGMYFIPSYDGKLYAVSEGTGTVKWAYHIGGPVSSSPAADERRVVCGGANGGVYSLDPRSGRLQWKFDSAGAVKSFLNIENDKVYAGSDDRALYCLDAGTGNLVWKYQTRGVIFAKPAVLGDKVFIASYDSGIYCLDARTGEEVNRFGSSGSIYSSPAVDGGNVYFGNNEGKFYCLDIYNKGTS